MKITHYITTTLIFLGLIGTLTILPAQSLPDNIDTSDCTVTPPAKTFDMKLKYQVKDRRSNGDAVLSASTPLVADLNGDGIPEIIGVWCPDPLPDGYAIPGGYITYDLMVYDGKTGNFKYKIKTKNYQSTGQTIAIGDVDGDGKCEIFIVSIGGRIGKGVYGDKYVYCYDGSKANTDADDYKWKSAEPLEHMFTPMLADVNNDGFPELVCGGTIFNAITGTCIVKGELAITGMGFGDPQCCHGEWNAAKTGFLGENYYLSALADIDGDKNLELCAGNTVYKITIRNPLGLSGNKFEILRQCTAPLPYNDMYDGQTIVLDFDNDGDLDVCVLGNRKDMFSQSIFSTSQNHIGLYVWDGQTSEMLGYCVLNPKTFSFSVPFAADINGDGFPEIIANGWILGYHWLQSDRYMDMMHVFRYKKGYTSNGELRAENIEEIFTREEATEFSESAGFTVFDFNQDGKSELVYRGRNNLFILDGTSLEKLCPPRDCLAGTASEYPIVADVDCDGHADIIVTEQYGSSGVAYIAVYESETPGAWGPARRVWNQWPYNVVNVNEDMTIPKYQFDVSTLFPNGTKPFNSFLQQATKLNSNGDMFMSAADVEALPDENTFQNLCDKFVINLKYTNRGSLMLSAPYSVTVFKNNDRGQVIRSAQKNQNLMVGDTTNITFTFTEAEINNFLPMDSLVVVVNNAGTGTAQNGGQQQECNNKNNYASCPFDGLRSSEEYDQNIIICEGEEFVVGESHYTRSGNYTDTLKNIHGCDSIVKTHLTVSSISVDLGPDQSYCEHLFDNQSHETYAPVTLNAGNSAASCLWEDGSTNSTRTTPANLPAGIYEYSVTVTNRDGCTASDTLLIEVIHNPEITITKTPEDYCKDGIVTLTANADIENVMWQWATGENTPDITITTEAIGPGVRVFVVGDNNGCLNSATDTVAPCPCEVELFNAFTPNGDGINDLFAPKLNADFKYYQFIIYDRWGKSVFKSEDPEEQWDGTIHGQKASDGVYYYVFTYACMSAPDEKISKHGSITLIR